MAFEEVDLTIESVFAGDSNHGLRIRDAFNYQRSHGADDARERIFDYHDLKVPGIAQHIRVQIFTDAQLRYDSGPDNILAEDNFKSDDCHCADCYYGLFGKMPEWYKNDDPWVYAYESEDCDRCGAALNVANRVDSLCSRCDSQLEYDHLQSSDILTS